MNLLNNMTSPSKCFLDQFKIDTRLLFAGNLTKQACFQDVEYRISGDLVNTDKSMHQTFWLGIHSDLGEEQLDYVFSKIESFFG